MKQPSAYFPLGPTHRQSPQVNTQSLLLLALVLLLSITVKHNTNKWHYESLRNFTYSYNHCLWAPVPDSFFLKL